MTTTQRETPRISGMCVISLICGLVWFFGLGSLLAVIYGFIGVRECRRKGMRGEPAAYVGVILGTLGLLGTVIYVVGSMP